MEFCTALLNTIHQSVSGGGPSAIFWNHWGYSSVVRSSHTSPCKDHRGLILISTQSAIQWSLCLRLGDYRLVGEFFGEAVRFHKIFYCKFRLVRRPYRNAELRILSKLSRLWWAVRLCIGVQFGKHICYKDPRESVVRWLSVGCIWVFWCIKLY